jgi:hypothetical protein
MSDIGIQVLLPEPTYRALQRAAAQKHQSESELVRDALEMYLKPTATVDTLLGLFSDEPELIDAITARAMESREKTPLRLPG